MNKLRFCLVYFSLLVLVLGAAAQVQNGQFTGTVADPSGAAIANAKVTVTNMGTNLSVTTTTNDTGLYTSQGTSGRHLPDHDGSQRLQDLDQHQCRLERRNHRPR